MWKLQKNRIRNRNIGWWENCIQPSRGSLLCVQKGHCAWYENVNTVYYFSICPVQIKYFIKDILLTAIIYCNNFSLASSVWELYYHSHSTLLFSWRFDFFIITKCFSLYLITFLNLISALSEITIATTAFWCLMFSW